MEENKDIYLRAGMNDVVLKPFLEKELLEKINRYI
jgi:CheY-like chemotaxis protein